MLSKDHHITFKHPLKCLDLDFLGHIPTMAVGIYCIFTFVNLIVRTLLFIVPLNLQRLLEMSQHAKISALTNAKTKDIKYNTSCYKRLYSLQVLYWRRFLFIQHQHMKNSVSLEKRVINLTLFTILTASRFFCVLSQLSCLVPTKNFQKLGQIA